MITDLRGEPQATSLHAAAISRSTTVQRQEAPGVSGVPSYCRLPSPLRSAAWKSAMTLFRNSLWLSLPSPLVSVAANC